MQIPGEWSRSDDGVYRPIVRGRVSALGGRLVADEFLVDVGADRSVFSAALLAKLDLPVRQPSEGVGMFGAGGQSEFVLVNTLIELETTGGPPARIRGEFAAFAGSEDLGFSLLGRDVLNLFDVIISRRNNEIALLAPNHQYRIIPPS